MEYREGQYADGKEIKLILIGLAVVLACMVGFTAFQQHQKRQDSIKFEQEKQAALAKHPYPDIGTQPEASEAKADELVRKCKGDITNLSQDDYHWLDSATSSHSAEFATMRYEFLLKQDKEKLASKSKHTKLSAKKK